ncbi:hypothetical protein BCR35DRAFT_303376 [Leucosporidium creatinivorum]|uniref:Uncharacterized protein n=1 Tax=Leucosporidium creatinivorum TaxID=106004 RepID=A0A1Y2FHT3_9BASI|nr:hypothetical protein BCR35DRAFT_303376 [Leucosporidium creatinivorum]
MGPLDVRRRSTHPRRSRCDHLLQTPQFQEGFDGERSCGGRPTPPAFGTFSSWVDKEGINSSAGTSALFLVQRCIIIDKSSPWTGRVFSLGRLGDRARPPRPIFSRSHRSTERRRVLKRDRLRDSAQSSPPCSSNRLGEAYQPQLQSPRSRRPCSLRLDWARLCL